MNMFLLNFSHPYSNCDPCISSCQFWGQALDACYDQMMGWICHDATEQNNRTPYSPDVWSAPLLFLLVLLVGLRMIGRNQIFVFWSYKLCGQPSFIIRVISLISCSQIIGISLLLKTNAGKNICLSDCVENARKINVEVSVDFFFS